MRWITKPALAAMAGLMALSLMAPAVSAQPARCEGQGPCTQEMRKDRPQAKDSRQKPQEARKQQHEGPRVGQSARRAPMLQQARNSRLPAPPAHQHYRVVDDRVVRVDDNTMKIVAIVGLASALLNTN